MTQQQSTIILLIKSALTGQPYRLPDDTNLAAVFQTAKAHGVDVMVYYGCLLCGVDRTHPVMQEQTLRVYRSITISETQLSAIRKITGQLESHGVNYMPLKGTLLKSLYPKAEMRRMGDGDILIDLKKYKDIRSFMSDLGYIEKYESNHEIVWEKHPVTVEFHKLLIPSYNKDFFRYFGDGWKLAKPVPGHSYRYEMTPEDEMIYLFTHFAKHYRDAGIGIRHIVDLWVYRQHHPKLDLNYLRRELEQLHLWEFYENVIRTLGVWFENYPADEKTEHIAQFIFTSGEYGRTYISSLSSTLKGTKGGHSVESVKRKRVLQVLFPGYKTMCLIYPVLRKAPILLPALWLVRLFEKVFVTKRVKSFANRQLSVEASEVSQYQQSLNFVGLDFHFTE